MSAGTPLVWAASLTVCAAGWLTAHSLAYRLVASWDGGAGALVEQTGHDDLASSPVVLAVSAFVLLAALAGAIVAGAARRAPPRVPLKPFLVLPLLDLIAHALLEWLHERGMPAGAALEPVFLLAVTLQVPFALAALLLARAALAWAENLGRGLTPRWHVRPVAPSSPAPPRLLIGTEHRPIIPSLASGCAQRGPPRAVIR